MNKRTKIAAGVLAVVAAVAGAGVAYAAYARSNNADAVGTSEKFLPLTVSGQWIGGPNSTGLLPGEAGDVKITVSVSDDNTVGAKVTSITAKQITAGDISGIPSANKEACAKLLKPATYAPESLVLAKGATNVPITLKSAVLFDPTATEACEGMQFATKWTVTFAPDRATSGLVGSGQAVSVDPGTVPVPTPTA